MIYILVEGHGDTEAVSNLVSRLWLDLQLPFIPIYSPGIRWKNIHMDQGLERGVEYVRTKREVTGLLFIRDDEDHCPATFVPDKVQFLSTLNAPFPIAYQIMYREFETLFLPCLNIFAGREVKYRYGAGSFRIANNAKFNGNPEQPRDAKGKVSEFYPDGKSYKPTLDQLPLTRMIDFNVLRESGLPCFGTLERCLCHLSENQGSSLVYPTP